MNNAVLIISVLVVVAGVVVFNRLVRGRQLVREAWSGIDVQLKRRHDLVPNLVKVVKGQMDYERGLMEIITAIRASAGDVRRTGETESELTRQIRNVLAVAESYPDLTSGRAALELQRSLSEVEDDIQYARRYYNGTVRDYNTLVQSFPANAVAATFGFHSEDFFEIEYATQRQTPDVAFS